MRNVSLLPLFGLGLLAAGCSADDPTAVSDETLAPPAFAVVAGTPLSLGETTLSGVVEHNDVTYTLRLKLDRVSYQSGVSHKVWIKPEDYKIDKGGFSGNLSNCISSFGQNVLGTGVRGVSSASAPTVTCDWKVGFGNQPPGNLGEVTLTEGGALVEADPRFRSFNAGGKTISGTFEYNGVEYTVSQLLDVLDYRNGTSHKAWTKPQGYQLDRGAFPSAGAGYQINCPSLAGPGARLVAAGSAPRVACTWKAGNGSGAPTGDFELK